MFQEHNPDPCQRNLASALRPSLSGQFIQERAADRDPQPVIRRFLSCIGYSAVVTRRSRACAPFDGTYVDAAPFSLDLAGKRLPTQSSRLDVLVPLSVARGPGS